MLDFHEGMLEGLPLKGLKSSGENHLVAVCPFHDDTNPSMSIHRYTGYYACFSCDASGPFEQLYKHLTGKSINIQNKRISLDPVLKLIDNLSSTEKQVLLQEDELSNYQNKIHIEIAERIGHRLDIVKYFELGYDDQKAQSTFPVRNEEGNLVGLVRRNPNGVVPKYRNAFKKSDYLYNLYRAKEYRKVIVVEGPMDVIKGHINGYPNCVALLGKVASKRQVQLLLRHFTDIVLALDADMAGRTGVDDLITKLKGKIKLFVVQYPSGYKDIGDLDAEQMKILVEKAPQVY